MEEALYITEDGPVIVTVICFVGPDRFLIMEHDYTMRIVRRELVATHPMSQKYA